MRYHLLTTYYVAEDEERNQENLLCLQKNLECPELEKIYLILQNDNKPDIDLKGKVEFIHLGKRPCFADFFEITRSKVESGLRFVVANSDIYFNETLRKLDSLDLSKKLVTLTRWDLQEDNSLKFYNKYLSQDTWIYSDVIPEGVGEYFIGQHGCDNRLLFELNAKGIEILNPSLVVKSIHVHMSQLRPYFENPNYKFVDPPYKYSFPSGLVIPAKLFFLRLFNSSKYNWNKYNLADYYCIRFEYYRARSKNILQKIPSSNFERLIGFLCRIYFYLRFQLAKRLR